MSYDDLIQSLLAPLCVTLCGVYAAFKFAEAPDTKRVYRGVDPISELLNLWYERGEAAGNQGDLYDNRDDGHSRLPKKQFPQVSHVEYSAKAREAGVNFGVNSQLLFNAITFGNSSTALTSSNIWRSQARLVLTTPELVARAYQHYVNDHLYVFPEHAARPSRPATPLAARFRRRGTQSPGCRS